MIALKSNQFWGRRSGAYDPNPPKGSNQPWGFYFRQQQFGAGVNRNRKTPAVELTNVNKKWFRKGG